MTTSRDFFASHLDDYLGELRRLVELESPTGDLPRIRRAASFLESLFSSHGEATKQELPGWGPLLRVQIPGKGPRVLLVAHYDTVWPVDSWHRLWSEQGAVISGPGIYDMKAGLLFILWMLRFFTDSGSDHPCLDIVLTPDEEVGAVGSGTTILEAARAADYALVTEPTTVDGCLKVARKGSGEFILSIDGRTAHQGVEPENGINAVVEAAHQILALTELEDSVAGTTVGPNVVHGGTVSNSVPDRCEVKIDVRAWTETEQARITAALRDTKAVLPGAKITLSGGWNRPPMESTPASMSLFERARAVGLALGLNLHSVHWGGSSDANLTASVGTPTVDGLGPTGAGSHCVDEHIVVTDLPDRLALLTDLVASLVHPPAESAGAG